MHILLVDRINSLQQIGGDTIQISAISKYLESIGHTVVVSSEIRKYSDENLDLIIFFNLTNPYELLYQWNFIKNKSIPYAIFPVYWNLKKAIPWNAYVGGWKKIIHLLPESIFNTLKWTKVVIKEKNKNLTTLSRLFFLQREIRKFLTMAQNIFVNSEAEKHHLIKEFGLYSMVEKIKVVRNGIEEQLKLSEKNKFQLPFSDYICCAGGIGPRKNQLNLVRAANRSGVNLVIIGKPATGEEMYFKKIKNIAKKNIFFIGYLERKEMLSILFNAKGHIQPSFIETPGLVSLEAAALGCKIAVSNVEPVKEYFGRFAIYSNPMDVESISDCLLELWNTHLSEQEKKDQIYYIKSTYSWRNVLKALSEEICTGTRVD